MGCQTSEASKTVAPKGYQNKPVKWNLAEVGSFYINLAFKTRASLKI